MRNGFKIFDTHAHLGEALHSGKVYRTEQVLEAMRRSGVDRSVLIPFPMVEDYRRAHNEIAQAVRDFPEAFTGCVCLDPYVGVQKFKDEVRRCTEELGFRAVKLQPQYQALNPISSRSDFFFETAVRWQLPVICHTGAGVPFALPSLFIVPARKFPELTIILGHAGGSIFMYETVVATQVCPNIYIELSSLMPHHIADILSYVESTRLLIGSDGIESLEAEVSKVLTMELSKEDKRNVLWETAHRIFGRASKA